MPAWSLSLRQQFLALAPYAAVAGPLCSAVRDGTFSGITRLGDICAAAGIAEVRSKAVEAALAAGLPHGLFERCSGTDWRPGKGPFQELATSLEAVTLYREHVHVDASRVEVVLTPPGNRSQLGDALRLRGWVESDLEHTQAILLHLATQARQRLAVLSPFVDVGGMDSLLTLLRATKYSVRRILITRCQDGVLPASLQAALPELAALDVAIHNYWLPHEGGYETFHAKAVLADSRMAYVGSANMTQASLYVSMELGAFLQGDSVNTLASVVDAILAIAPQLK
jgi:phosphatidylserine/phosphatidylglycerophosphate/cardiolipin synthase-like enzyme